MSLYSYSLRRLAELQTGLEPRSPKDKKRRDNNSERAKGLHLSIANGFVLSKIYDKRDDFDFDIVNFPFFGW